MAIKITAENIHFLKEGDVLAKYPNCGKHTDVFDVNDKERMSIMQVVKVSDRSIDLSIAISIP